MSYRCSGCKREFKTLANLGTHTNKCKKFNMKPWEKRNISKEQWIKEITREKEEIDNLKIDNRMYVSRPDLEAEYIYYHGTWVPKKR